MTPDNTTRPSGTPPIDAPVLSYFSLSPDTIRPPKYFRWPMIVIGLLLGHICIMVVAVTIATRVRPDSIVPDYYQKSVNWDRNHPNTRAASNAATSSAIPTATNSFAPAATHSAAPAAAAPAIPGSRP